MYCVYCNYPLKGDERECPSCGRPSGTFVQIEAFRDGKGQKAAATSLSGLKLTEKPQDIPAKVSAMTKEIKVLKKENENLKKEQISLRAAVDTLETSLEGNGVNSSGSFIPALISAAIAALIPLIAMVVIYSGLNKRIVGLEQELLEMTGRVEATETALNEKEAAEQYPADMMSENDAVQTQIADLQSTVAGLEKEIDELRKIIEGRDEEEETEEPEVIPEEDKEGSEALGEENSEESSGETSEGTGVEKPNAYIGQNGYIQQEKATTGVRSGI